ncbi:hypothetical protein NGRA_2967 [Nosema granulosis]|uniref:Pol polyprotein n=1 Tax=Nosema granulosis TaxID=83296 RepID=A0A9P6KX75_9MICR|nr:hypothetical protein NGRA_2967 [Nosema granulosis]
MYCKYHKPTLHSTEDCRVLARKREQERTYVNPRNFVLKESDMGANLLQLGGTIAGIPTKFTIDTGATKNYIGEKFVTEYRLKTTETEPSEVIYGNGEVCQSTKQIDTVIEYFADKRMNVPVSLAVIINLPEEITLGNPFLKERGAVINFTEYTLKIDDREYRLDCQEITDWRNSPDYQLLCKADGPTDTPIKKALRTI